MIPTTPALSIEFLSETFPWADDKFLKTLQKQGEWRHFAVGQQLFYEGEEPTEIFLIAKGVIKTFISDHHKHETIITLYKSSDLLGFRSLLVNEPHDKSARAIQETEVLVLSKKAFLEFIQNNPSSIACLLKTVEKNLSDIEMRATQILQQNTTKRMANALLMLYKKFGIDQRQNINLDFTPREFAQLINTTRTTVYRILSKMEKEGYLQIDHNRIRVKDLNALNDLAGV